MDPISVALRGGLLPAVAAGAVLLLLRLARGPGGGPVPFLPALAAAFLAGWVGIEGVPRRLPAESVERLLPLALAALVPGFPESRQADPPAWRRWGLRVLLVALAAWFVPPASLRSTPRAAGFAAAGLLSLLLWDRAAAREGGTPFPLALLVAGLGTAASLLASGSMRMAALALPFAGAAGAAAVLARWIPAAPRGSVPLAAAVPGALLALGTLLLDPGLPPLSAGLLLAAPAGMLIPGRRPWVRILAVLLLAGAGTGIAVHESPPFD